MRQPTHDFHVDPHKQVGTFTIGAPNPNGPIMAFHSTWVHNAIVSKSHAFCGKTCMNLSTPTLDKGEEQCLDQCLTKYGNALELLNNERSTFSATLKDIELNGGDIYARINSE